MKKAIIIGFLALFPIIGFAQADKVGIEYLSPLVQTIIKLLQERIAVLQKEVDTCNAKLQTNSTLSNPIIASTSPVSLSAFDFKLSSKIVGQKVILTADGFRDKESVRGGFRWRTENRGDKVIISKDSDMVFLPQKEGISEKIQFIIEIPLEELSPYNTLGYTTHYFQFRFARGNNSISTSDSLEFATGY